jgi:hypothetical protein
MNHRIKQFLVAAAVLGCAHTASAAERNPALDLLVKKGLITAEERAQALEQAAVAKMAEPAKKTPWYEKMKIDGYTQVRHTEQLNGAAYLTGGLPADRSVDPNNSFVVRRARFKFQGDFGRVYLYYQTDAAASVDSGSKRNFGLQTRDIYADIALDEDKEHRIRAGVSKVPFGWVNMQSSQNRLAIERPEGINSAVEGERDQGVYYMYASKEDRALLKKLVKEGYKGSGDYGIFTAGFYSGAGLNRADNNGEVHSIIRYTKPWVAASGQMYEAGLVAYAGRFKVSTADTSTTVKGALEANIDANDRRDLSDGFVDRRAAATFIMYPQPWGIEAEWNVGQSPMLNDARDNITNSQVEGGYILVNYQHKYGEQSVFQPFVRWSYNDGARKFATNAPKQNINEIDVGFEWKWRKEVELVLSYTFSKERTNTSTTNPLIIADSQRATLQLQFEY